MGGLLIYLHFYPCSEQKSITTISLNFNFFNFSNLKIEFFELVKSIKSHV